MVNQIENNPLRPVIIPILSPAMNWNSYLRDGFTCTGERFNKSLDAGGMKPGQDESIIVGLSQFTSSEYLDVLKTVRTVKSPLQLLYFAFLCSYDSKTLNWIVLNTGLNGILHSDQKTWIIGGNLLQWKEAIVDCCIEIRLFEIRFFMNSVFVLFQLNGYQNVWSGYGKIQLPDGTFTFRHKLED
jgi:hypothetical protein